MTRPFCQIVVLMVCSVSSLLHAQDKPQAARDVGDAPLSLRFYALAELASPLRQFPYNAALPTSSAAATGVEQPPVATDRPAAQPGGGFGGGGGGLFSVPATAQFGGGGMGGGGMGGGSGEGGFGGAMNVNVPQQHLYDSYDDHETLINLLTAHVAPDSWETNGGQATISAVNNTLLIRQTGPNHEAIRDFLRELTATTVGGQPLSIEVWWLPLDNKGRRDLNEAVNSDDRLARLNQLSESMDGFHGILKTRNQVSGNLCSGYRTPLVVGQIPVVGANSSGLQPVVTQVNIGINVEITPRLQPDWQGTGVNMAVRTAVTTLDEHERSAADGDQVDRFQLGNLVLETNITAALDVPLIVGSLSAAGLFPEGVADRELVLVVLPSRDSVSR